MSLVKSKSTTYAVRYHNKIIKKYYPESEFLAQGSTKSVYKLDDRILKIVSKDEFIVLKELHRLGLYSPIYDTIKVNSENYLVKEKYLKKLSTPHVNPDDFDSSSFSDTEKENLEVIENYVKESKEKHNIIFRAYPGSIWPDGSMHGWEHVAFGRDIESNIIYILDIDWWSIYLGDERLIEVLKR
jgi:hypothetical protein